MYYQGYGVSVDYTQTHEWLKKAMEQDYPYAYFQVGFMIEEGKAFKKDVEIAKTYYQKAAELGSESAISRLEELGDTKYKTFETANKYYYGLDGVNQNYYMALQYFKDSAENGNIIAQYMLGSMYYEGKGCSRNYREAFTWLKKAANAGNSDAQYRVGVMYDNGLSVSKDTYAAKFWYNKSGKNQ